MKNKKFNFRSIATAFIGAAAATSIGYNYLFLPETPVKPVSMVPGQEKTKRFYRDIFRIEAADGRIYSISRTDWQTRDRIRKAMDQDCSIIIKHQRIPNVLSENLYRISSVSPDYIDCRNG